MKKTMYWAAAAVSAALFLTGCKDYVGKEKSHPLFVKAGQAKQSGKSQEAAAFFRDFLDVCPKSPLAHYEIASVYSDDLDEPLKALYHYERFLELAPNSPDAENVRKFAEASRKKLFEKLEQIYPPKANPEEQKKIQKLQASLDQYIRYSQELLKQNERMREVIKSGELVKKLLASSSVQTETQSAAPVEDPQRKPTESPVQKPQEASPPAAGGTSAAPQYYVVQPGDSLSKISLKFYQSRKYYSLIRSANNLRSDSIYAGQKLLIPKLNGK